MNNLLIGGGVLNVVSIGVSAAGISADSQLFDRQSGVSGDAV